MITVIYCFSIFFYIYKIRISNCKVASLMVKLRSRFVKFLP
jgi:hypothetical protein